MERKQPETVVAGMKYLDSVLPLLERLRDVGCARDRAGNRELRMPQYVGLVLLSLFNPTLGSLRGLQQASELEKVQRKLGACVGSLWGHSRKPDEVFDPDQLGGIIGELLAKLPGATRRELVQLATHAHCRRWHPAEGLAANHPSMLRDAP